MYVGVSIHAYYYTVRTYMLSMLATSYKTHNSAVDENVGYLHFDCLQNHVCIFYIFTLMIIPCTFQLLIATLKCWSI